MEVTTALAGVLLVGQSIAIGGLMLHVRRRQKIAAAEVERHDELRHSQSRHVLATAAGAVGVWDWDFEHNELFIDSTLKALLGFEDGEISTRPDDWGSRVHPQDLPHAADRIEACVRGSTDAYALEHRMIHKDGTVRWMSSRGTALRAANGKLLRLVGTKLDITERKTAEDALREREAVLDASHRRVRDLAGRLIAAQEAERARLARDLHDDLSQHIAGLSIALSVLRRNLEAIPGGADLAGDVVSLQQRSIGLADNIRRLSHDLHPNVLQQVGLGEALKAHCGEIDRRGGVAVVFSGEGDVSVASPGAALCLYRVVQEGLRNVLLHAGASRAEVRLTVDGEAADLTIQDDGRGFDVMTDGRGSRGLGLVSITERVRLAGGSVTIESELTRGTRVHVSIPINAAAAVLRG